MVQCVCHQNRQVLVLRDLEHPGSDELLSFFTPVIPEQQPTEFLV
jgi:hypothetical protein